MVDTISVVMCVKNGAKTIETALKSVTENKPYEIIVVDGNSRDGTLDIAKKYTSKIYSDEGKGLAAARQVGVDHASGEFIAFIDSDTELPDETVLGQMLRELLEKKWVAIHAQLVDPRKNKSYWERGEDFHLRVRFNKPGEKRYLGTIVCLIRKDLITRYRFDPFYKGAAEDSDFYHRIGNEGYKFGVARTIAYHYHRASFKQFVKQRLWYGKGNARAIVKHKSLSLPFAPLGIALYGIWLCINHKGLRFIPFYCIWAIALSIGTILGLIETIFPSVL